MTRSLRLGSRQSELALVQANHTVSLIHQLFPDVLVEVVPIVTTGDRNVSIPLDEMGGKGVFIKELEQALLDERIDLAIHCLKDVTVASEYGLDYAGFLAVDFIPGVLVANQPISLEQECIIGTSSKRRQALLKHYCPSFQCKPIRGNIPTRLQKLREGDYDALVLSEASLRRLNIEDYWEYVFPLSHFIPAPGQGVLACQIRFDDDRIRQIVDAISDPHQTLISRFEYSLMKKPIIMTDFNIDLKNLNENFIIASSHFEFSKLIIDQIKNPQKLEELNLFAKNYEWSKISSEFRNFILKDNNS